jgi:hypothetical protein
VVLTLCHTLATGDQLAVLLNSATNTQTGLVLGLLYQGVELFFEFALWPEP